MNDNKNNLLDTKDDRNQYFPFIAGILSFANEFKNQRGKIKGNYLYARCIGAFGIGFIITKLIIKTLDEVFDIEKSNIKSLKQF